MVLMLNSTKSILLNLDNVLCFEIEEHRLEDDKNYRIIAHFRDCQRIPFNVFSTLEEAQNELQGMLTNIPSAQLAYTRPQKVQAL